MKYSNKESNVYCEFLFQNEEFPIFLLAFSCILYKPQSNRKSTKNLLLIYVMILSEGCNDNTFMFKLINKRVQKKNGCKYFE